MNAYCSVRGTNRMFIHNVDSFSFVISTFHRCVFSRYWQHRKVNYDQRWHSGSCGNLSYRRVLRVLETPSSRRCLPTFDVLVTYLGYINYNCIVISFLRFKRTFLVTGRYLAVCINIFESGLCFTKMSVLAGNVLRPQCDFELDIQFVVLQLIYVIS
jgi:hypothetical protein